MPQLETLDITFHSLVQIRVLSENSETPITRHVAVTLPNLRWFASRGEIACLEALLPHITTPLLGSLQIIFSNHLSFSVPFLFAIYGNKTS